MKFEGRGEVERGSKWSALEFGMGFAKNC